MEHRIVSRGERQIACWVDASAGAGTPAIAIHGGPGFTHRYLRPWAGAPLPGSVACFDLPGCGESSRHPGSGYPLAEYVADVEAVRQALGHDRAIVLGHAWGAILAVEYALAHPERVGALILVNPLRILRVDGQDNEAQARMIAAVDPQVLDPYLAEVQPQLQRALGGDAGAWRAVDASPWWSRMWRTQFLEAPPEAWTRAVGSAALGLESYFAHKGAAFMDPAHPFNRYDLAERIRGLDCPVLVVASDSDANYVAPARIHAEPLAQAAPRGELAMIRQSGHFPFVDQPTQYAAAVGGFLERIVR